MTIQREITSFLGLCLSLLIFAISLFCANSPVFAQGGLSAQDDEVLISSEKEESSSSVSSTQKPRAVNFLAMQKDLKLTCPWLVIDRQREALLTALVPYENLEECRVCRAFARVWRLACKTPLPPFKAKPKKKGKKIVEEVDTEAETTPMASPVPTNSNLVAVTPSTELLSIVSRISRLLAEKPEDQAELRLLFAMLIRDVPVSSKVYFDTLTQYLVSAWPETTVATGEVPVEEAIHEELKKQELDQLF